MQSFRTVVMCVVISFAPVLGHAAEPGAPISTTDQVALLRRELAVRNAEIAGLQAALRKQVVQANAVVAFSDGPTITNGNRELTPSSSISHDRGQQIAKLLSILKPGSSFSTVLPTGSMKPFFDEKAVLLMENAPFEDLKVGDIVTYRHPQMGVPVVHRLVLKEGDKFWARGDANSQMDDVYVTADNYLKRVYAVIYTDGATIH